MSLAFNSRILCGLSLVAVSGCLSDPSGSSANTDPTPARLGFVPWTTQANLEVKHELDEDDVEQYLSTSPDGERALLGMTASIALGDIDNDGWVDLVVVGGKAASVMKNVGDGTFANASSDYELSTAPLATGPLLADLNGDGFLDLVVGGLGEPNFQLFLSVDGERFEDATSRSRVATDGKVVSIAAGDADGDGDLDLLLARYGGSHTEDEARSGLFWVNDGSARFDDHTGRLRYPTSSVMAGDAGVGDAGVGTEVALSPQFVDIDGDSDRDVALLQDVGLSAVLSNAGTDAGVPVYELQETQFPTPLGRGSALGDYDNDGDLDWFMSGVEADLSGFESGDGNHLYRNDGDGEFEDVTQEARVGDGSFAWGSCFEDFDNDGHLDLFQVNGWNNLVGGKDAGSYRSDRSRLFLNQQDGTFAESSEDVGLVDDGDGRAVACFDYDHDGDIDIVVGNADGSLGLFGNTLNPWGRLGANYVCVILREEEPSRSVVGANVRVRTGQLRQEREVHLGSYVSQVSTELHFGVGAAEVVDRIDITWTDGDTGFVENWPVNNCLVATHRQHDE